MTFVLTKEEKDLVMSLLLKGHLQAVENRILAKETPELAAIFERQQEMLVKVVLMLNKLPEGTP